MLSTHKNILVGCLSWNLITYHILILVIILQIPQFPVEKKSEKDPFFNSSEKGACFFSIYLLQGPLIPLLHCNNKSVNRSNASVNHI